MLFLRMVTADSSMAAITGLPSIAASESACVDPLAVSHTTGVHNTDMFIADVQADQHEQAVIWRHKLKYRFDTFMARGGASIFKALVLSFLMIFFNLS